MRGRVIMALLEDFLKLHDPGYQVSPVLAGLDTYLAQHSEPAEFGWGEDARKAFPLVAYPWLYVRISAEESAPDNPDEAVGTRKKFADPVDQASWESFPASDPPGWTG